MCEANHQFLFCTCAETTDSSSSNNTLPHYAWTLSQLLGQKETHIRGKLLGPKEDLGEHITIEAILHQLNTSSDNFDFDYTPHQDDCLSIRIDHPTEGFQYFKVKYQAGEWIKGGHPPFTSITREIKQGKIVKITPPKI